MNDIIALAKDAIKMIEDISLGNSVTPKQIDKLAKSLHEAIDAHQDRPAIDPNRIESLKVTLAMQIAFWAANNSANETPMSEVRTLINQALQTTDIIIQAYT